MAQPVVFPKNPPSREVEFRVHKEDWSKYVILGGKGQVWLRAILVKLHEIDKSKLPPNVKVPPGGEFQMSMQNVVTSFFNDKSLKGKPDNTPHPPESFETGGEDIAFEAANNEPFNEYVTLEEKPRLIQLKVVVSSVRLYRNRFNQFGDPIIVCSSQVVVSPARDAKSLALQNP